MDVSQPTIYTVFVEETLPLVVFLPRKRACAEEDVLAHPPLDARALTLQARLEVTHFPRKILQTANFRPTDFAPQSMPQASDKRSPGGEGRRVFIGADGADSDVEDRTSSSVEVQGVPSHDALRLNSDEPLLQSDDPTAS